MNYKSHALLATLILSVSSIVFATEVAAASASVITDKTSYNTGDVIIVSGNVGTVKPGVPALIEVFNSNNAVYRYDVISASEIKNDGSFTYNPTPPLRVGGSLGISGQYKVVISYGGQNVAQTTFQFTSTVAKPTPTGNQSSTNQTTPEFGAGSIAAIVLAIAIVATIVSTAKYSGRNRFLPK